MGNFLCKQKSLPLLLAGSFLLAGSHSAFAQSDAGDSLSAAFLRYPSQWMQEKIFVHVDKTFYLAGEIIWFKAYDVDARYNTALTISGIAYVEILDKDQKAILQEKIELNKGTGDGSFRIPSSVASGHYTFRAYTSWMRNFSPDFYFQQRLTILNTLNNESDADLPPLSPSTDGPSHEDYAIRFFPEGGNLVNNLPSVVAVKATRQTGEGVTCSGAIIDQNKDTVARFNTDRSGMGRFTFTPSRGNTYSALITTASSTLTGQLPSAFDDGLVMHLDDIDAHTLRISVRSSTMPADPTLYLFVHTRHRIRSIQANRLVDNQTAFPIDKDSLDDGISHITLFTADRIPVCERLYCKPPGKRLHIDVNTMGAAGAAGAPAADPFAVSTRHNLSVDLSTTNPSGHPVNADLSISVFLIDSLQPIPDENILTYLLLRSDLKGKIECPQSYFANTDPETIEALDNLMLTQGWTRFRWEDLLRNKKPVFEFLPESNGPIIHAKLIDKATGLPPSPVIGYLSVPGRRFKLATAMSREEGSLFFHVGRFYGNKEVILQTNALTDSNYRIDISNPFSDRFSLLPDADSLFSSRWKGQLLSRSIGVQAENAYRTGEKYRLLPASDKDSTGFYGIADRRYNLDEYTRFVTMDEVIREFVDDVKVRLISGKTSFRVRNALFNLFFEDDPLLLIDGVPVFNGDKMIGINPLKIEKIDVVLHRYYLGPSITDGIVSFQSYDGDLAGYQLDPNAVVVQYNGLQEHREFYSPVYQSEDRIQSPLPDLRNQLLWCPDITTDSTGKKQLSLYTSDLTGTFALIVQGLSGDGLAGYAVKTFTVSPKRTAAQ
jgi:hypothetical protein